MLATMERLAKGTSAPAAEITVLHLRAMRKDATLFDKRRYAAVRDHFETKPVEAPDGSKYKLKALQRIYLRYVLVKRYKQDGNTWDASCELTSEYLCSSHPVSPKTVMDSYSEMKKILGHPKMPAFCKGLEYEYPVAMAGDDEPASGTYLNPEYFAQDDHP